MSIAIAECARAGVECFEPLRVQLPATDHELTVILPAHNEERRLPATLAELRRVLDTWPVDYRVLVVDDGSTDGTARLTRGFDGRFSTLSLPQCKGKGHAVRSGMLRATGQVVAFTDADLPFELSALRDGMEMIRDDRCQVVFGARDLRGATTVACRRWSRRMATFIFRQMMRRLVSREVTDTQCGLKVFKREAALEIFSRTTIDGFAFDAEVVMLTLRLSLPFARVPVRLINDYDSSLSLARHAIPMLREVVGCWARAFFAAPEAWRPGWFSWEFVEPRGSLSRAA